MKIDRYRSDPSQTPYAPNWDLSIGYSSIPLRIDRLVATCLEKEKEILKLPPSLDGNDNPADGNTGLGFNSTTSRFSRFNVFDWDTRETNLLKKYVRENIEQYNKDNGNETPQHLWVRCWVNIMRFGQKIKKHTHSTDSDCYLSSHFTVQCNNTSTCYVIPLNEYSIINEENKVGQISIFPSYVPHYTTRHLSIQPRITIAMDIFTHNRNLLVTKPFQNFVKL
tara:strand:+ start:44 stop:712 length:669 start_codon:yes stop_codon:yes gene_type:complete